MHICIFGTGAAGWIACHSLKNLDFVKKITIIGSDKIPTIGVGESTTLLFHDWVQTQLNFTEEEYIKFFLEIDAAIKYGVSYENWSSKKYLHGFYRASDEFYYNSYLLANKPTDVNVNEYNSLISKICYNNDISYDDYNCPHAWHFDANKLIYTLQNLAKQSKKINYKIGTLERVKYLNDKIDIAFLEDGTEISADYYVNCIGSTSFNQKIFDEKYISYSDVLLTNKAVFCPLEYKDKHKQFHPYTAAKAMNYGWRWITPTWSRIGTGYVFSDNYCSVDQAMAELKKDIGHDVELNVVDFSPRRVEKVFKENYCTIGMASGFLEPLDAPGLDLSLKTVFNLLDLLTDIASNKSNRDKINNLNDQMNFEFNFWASFILLQYKTSNKIDTKFWIDHKNVKFDFFEERFKELEDDFTFQLQWEKPMFYHTIAGKDINWNISSKELPKKIESTKIETINHYEAMSTIRNRFNLETSD